MKFFKHFCDSHRGRSIQILIKKHGFAGVGRYWTFIELCAEKLEKMPDEEFSDAHCNFEFEKTFLMRALGYHNLTHTRRYLSDMQVIGLCWVSDTDVTYKCYVPKLLESLDRDSRRARKIRPKIKIEDKEEDKETRRRTNENYSQLRKENQKQNRSGELTPLSGLLATLSSKRS